MCVNGTRALNIFLFSVVCSFIVTTSPCDCLVKHVSVQPFPMNRVIFVFFAVPTLHIEQSVYGVTEEDGHVFIVVSSTGERITTVNFRIATSNNSAIGKEIIVNF